MSAVELATEAAKAALADTGADADAVAKAIDVVVGLRQFEISAGMPAPLGKSNNYPRSVMQRLGAQPARVGHRTRRRPGPAETRHRIRQRDRRRRGRCRDDHRLRDRGRPLRYFAKRDDKPDFTEHIDGQLEDRGHQIYQLRQRVHDRARADRCARAVRAAGQRAPRPARAAVSPTTAGRWPSCSHRCRKSLRRTRFRHRPSSAPSRRSRRSPTTTG